MYESLFWSILLWNWDTSTHAYHLCHFLQITYDLSWQFSSNHKDDLGSFISTYLWCVYVYHGLKISVWGCLHENASSSYVWYLACQFTFLLVLSHHLCLVFSASIYVMCVGALLNLIVPPKLFWIQSCISSRQKVQLLYQFLHKPFLHPNSFWNILYSSFRMCLHDPLIVKPTVTNCSSQNACFSLNLAFNMTFLYSVDIGHIWGFRVTLYDICGLCA